MIEFPARDNEAKREIAKSHLKKVTVQFADGLDGTVSNPGTIRPPI